MVSVQNLTYFMKICETRSMNRAAAELYITQPALSLAMKKLEAELGVTLFERNNRGIELTEDGERLLRHCILLAKQMELIENIASAEEEQVLSVSAFPYIISPEVILRFKNDPECANVRIDLEECRVFQAMENVDSLISEFGMIQFNDRQQKVVRQKLDSMGLVMEVLTTVSWAVAVGPNSPVYNKSIVSMQELMQFRMLRMKDDLFSFVTGETVIDGISMNGLPYDNVYSGSVIDYMIRETDAYMFCGQMAHIGDPAARLHVIPVANSDIVVSVAKISRRRHRPGRAEERFMELVREDLGI